MANIEDWYGNNSIGWGKSYGESWWGSVNEANSWGIIYPNNAGGSIFTADTTNITADSSFITADNGVESNGVGSLPVITGDSLGDGFNLDNDLIPYWAGNIDHASLTSTPSLLGQAIYGAANQTQLSEAQAIQFTQFFAGITNVSEDTWYSIDQTFKVVETEADPDTIIHNMTDKTGAQVKYVNSTISGVDYIILIKGGTHNPKSTGSRQILTVGEAWNDRDIIKY